MQTDNATKTESLQEKPEKNIIQKLEKFKPPKKFDNCCKRFNVLKNVLLPWQRALLEYLARVGPKHTLNPYVIENVLKEFRGSIFRTDRIGLEFLNILFALEIIIPKGDGKNGFNVSPDRETRDFLCGFLPEGRELKIMVDCEEERFPYQVVIKLATDLKMRPDVISVSKRNYYNSNYWYGDGDEMIIVLTTKGERPRRWPYKIKDVYPDETYHTVIISPEDGIIS